MKFKIKKGEIEKEMKVMEKEKREIRFENIK